MNMVFNNFNILKMERRERFSFTYSVLNAIFLTIYAK